MKPCGKTWGRKRQINSWASSVIVFFAIAVSSISIAQGDFSVLDWENTIVGERHAVGVAAEVVEDGLGRAERLRWSFVEK